MNAPLAGQVCLIEALADDAQGSQTALWRLSCVNRFDACILYPSPPVKP